MVGNGLTWYLQIDADYRGVHVVLLGTFSRTRKEMQSLIEQNGGHVRSASSFLAYANSIGCAPFRYAYPFTFAYYYTPRDDDDDERSEAHTASTSKARTNKSKKSRSKS